MARRNRPAETVSIGSTADIAFLLLIFFLVTTTIVSDQGLALQLPPKIDQPPVPRNERNIFNVVVNGHDMLMVEGELRNDLVGIEEEIVTFLLNNGRSEKLSDSPKDAIVSLRADRGTTYQRYIEVYDLIKGAYYQLYSEKLGADIAQIRNPGSMPTALRIRYEQIRAELPMQISLAEPASATR